uniref:C6 domain-containing protein n=1 Tax=Strongyloides stercoralis TaxID=6248 RepID=A0AAF5DN34_STRER
MIKGGLAKIHIFQNFLNNLMTIAYFILTVSHLIYTCAPSHGNGGVKPNVTTTTTTQPTITTTTLTTTTTSEDCCPALNQTFEGTTFADGNLTLTYDNDNCRRFVDMFCTQPLADLSLYAAIVVNINNFMNYNFMNVTWNATCSNGVWLTGEPPLQIDTLQCLLTEPIT